MPSFINTSDSAILLAIIARDRHIVFIAAAVDASAARHIDTAHLQADRIQYASLHQAVCGSRPHQPSAQEPDPHSCALFFAEETLQTRNKEEQSLHYIKQWSNPPTANTQLLCIEFARCKTSATSCLLLLPDPTAPIPPKPDEAALARIYTRRHKLAEIGAPSEHRHRARNAVRTLSARSI